MGSGQRTRCVRACIVLTSTASNRVRAKQEITRDEVNQGDSGTTGARAICPEILCVSDAVQKRKRQSYPFVTFVFVRRICVYTWYTQTVCTDHRYQTS